MKAHTGSKAYRKLMAGLDQRARIAEKDLFDERMARVIRRIAEEVEAMRYQELMETVTVPEAAELTRYSESTIWRKIQEGKLENVGEDGQALLRVRDLPYKSGPESFHPAVLRRNGASPPQPTPDPRPQTQSRLTVLGPEERAG